MKRIIIQVVLGIVIVALSWLVYNSINKPLKFEKERLRREEIVIEKLKDIRQIEIVYKSVYGYYSDNFDTLISFVKNGRIPVVIKEGTISDSLFNLGYDEKRALKEKLIKRDTAFVAVFDSLFSKRENFNIDLLSFIPKTNQKFKFEIAVDTLKIQSFTQPVFEVKAPNKYYLSDQDKQLLANYNKKLEDMERYTGLKVGSLTEVTTDGNWE